MAVNSYRLGSSVLHAARAMGVLRGAKTSSVWPSQRNSFGVQWTVGQRFEKAPVFLVIF
jgi:hypothetical protein